MILESYVDNFFTIFVSCIDFKHAFDYIAQTMSSKLQFTLSFDEDLDLYMQKHHPLEVNYRIISKSLDARGAPKGVKPKFHYIIESCKSHESFNLNNSQLEHKQLSDRPIIIGAGPAGMFAALRFAEYGIASTIIERGAEANKRMLYISQYWKNGNLNTESNVCYGEGGAGLFSDGKLITRVKSDFIGYVMQKFVDFGAPAETAYISNPHLGSNKIRAIISKISESLISRGSEIIYDTRVEEILFEDQQVVGVKLSNGQSLKSKLVILATGHSASEMYHHLLSSHVAISPKDFAVGVRVEHPREVIDRIQHGQYCTSPELGAARYRLSYHDPTTERGTYSFCMCPGGYVLSSGTDKDGIVVNGMSNYARNSHWSNAALVVSVKSGVDFKNTHALAGLDFQHKIEKAAYQLSLKHADGRMLPAMTVGEFMNGKLNQKELPKTSSPSKIFKADLAEIFPSFILNHIKNGLREFNRSLNGFLDDNALLIAPETRTSSPVTIVRDKTTLESTSHRGLYPCGEGAGYAGGITSAAVDGIRVAESIIANLAK
jgi:uncharacterized FAD-dependent dehydrogenase